MTHLRSRAAQDSNLPDQLLVIERFKRVGLIFLWQVTARRWLVRFVALLPLLLAGLPAQANSYIFSDGSSSLPSGCRIVSAGNYSCGSLLLGTNDTLAIGSPTPVTITVNGTFTTTDSNNINSGGITSNLNLVVSGEISLGSKTLLNANVTGGSAIDIGKDSTVSGDITTTTITGVVTLGAGVFVGGNIRTGGGAINIGKDSKVGGAVASGDGVITLAENVQVGAGISSITGAINIGKDSKVGGAVSSVDGVITLAANVQVGAGISSITGAINIGKDSTSGAITTGAGVVTLGADVQVNGGITTKAGAVTIGAGSKVGGNINTDAGVVTLGADVHVDGSISSVSGAITIGARDTVCGAATSVSGVLTNATRITTRVCVPIDDPNSSKNAGAFECLETGTNSPWVAAARKPLYTKLVSTDFKIDIAALKTDGTLESNYVASGGTAKTVTLEWVDGSGTTACANRTPISPAVSQTLSFAAADAGRKSTVSMRVNKAYTNLRCRVTDANQSPSVVGCSTDNFSIRPQQFTVTAPTMNNTGLTLTPKDIAGNAFTLNADAGVVGGYSSTAPVLVATKVYDHNATAIAVGTISGTFAAGTGTSAQGASFKYLDVGNINLLADAVVDSSFTSVDQTTDCVTDSTANLLSDGKYGCNIGSAASGKFGRWYPSHYSFAGTLTAACTAGAFTYMDNDALGVTLTLRAHAYTGVAASASDPVTSRYTSGYTNLAKVTISGDNAGAAVAVTRLASPDFPVMPNTVLWTAGQWAINNTYMFAKLAAPDGPYDLFKLKAALTDPDGSALIGTATAQETATTKVRYGRIRMQNAYGSELLDLPMTMRSEYWGATGGWQLNSADTCTAATFAFAAVGADITGNTCVWDTGTTPGNSGKGCTTSIVVASRQFKEAGVAGFAGDFNLWFKAPGATHAGSLDVSAAVPAWLQYNWSGTVANPKGRAIFGVFRSPLIYRRENY